MNKIIRNTRIANKIISILAALMLAGCYESTPTPNDAASPQPMLYIGEQGIYHVSKQSCLDAGSTLAVYSPDRLPEYVKLCQETNPNSIYGNVCFLAVAPDKTSTPNANEGIVFSLDGYGNIVMGKYSEAILDNANTVVGFAICQVQ